MKKLVVLFALVLSSFISVQAKTYIGLDREGNSCALKIENEKISIETSHYSAIVSSKETLDGRLIYQSEQIDSRLNVTFRFTDRVEIELDGNKPIQYIASRKTEAKQNTWYGFFMETNRFGGNQEIRCSIN
ncbi:hypothetical protein HBN50_03445 [Halobacteriovorax sp. GB3]|uniref:hypothetical protein n=1 Tax=Halobacteriovorax sp. GB3 TaxID=2719615 RepID=UPI0023600990|nr:hypothetical protein [Halobacteriovorax sp. GB3]MDD0852132.1 hypothetical protein [Halobacteriovorax sp. GB3]